MTQKQSPSYPSFPLKKALELAGQIFEKDRKNTIDRGTAAEHIGYSSLSGPASKSLSTLAQFGLISKAGSGQIQVTQVLVDILYPDSPDAKKEALNLAGLNPQIFQEINKRFFDGTPSEIALKKWLVREEYLERAINPLTRSYLETISFLKQEGAINILENPDDESTSNFSYDSNNDALDRTENAQQAVDKARNTKMFKVDKLNEINAAIEGDRILISALLDRDGLDKLERKISALKSFLDD